MTHPGVVINRVKFNVCAPSSFEGVNTRRQIHTYRNAFYGIGNLPAYEIKEMLVQIERFKLFTHFQDGRHQINILVLDNKA